MKKNDLVDYIVKLLSDKKGGDISVISMPPEKSLFDYSVIVTSTGQRHSASLSDHVERELRGIGIKNIKIEGARNSDWILMDLGDIIVDIFTEETRKRYALEELWKDHEIRKLKEKHEA